MKRLIVVLIFLLSLPVLFTHADEGMYPISEIHKLDLKKAGFELTATEIFNPDGISLIDGICNVGGCTGSFVSGQGLIITNHHCAFRAIQQASTPENDYLEKGFIARTQEEEFPVPGGTVRITDSYKDVSAEVLNAVKDNMSFAERSEAIRKKINVIVKQAEEANPGKRASVSTMFTGKTYVLFIFTYLRDLRLVYAPPRSIGNFGGEADNWMWPRHTGDFSFMRAYVGPDGNPADYSPDNIRYAPKRVLKVAPEGVDNEDFVFILGYPGSTYRHRTSYYLSYEEEVRMPFVKDYYEWQIKTMEEISNESREIALKHESRIKGLSNTMKNYKGKLIGLKRLGLVKKKMAEEADLQRYIDADPKRRAEYGNVLNEIGKIYGEIRADARRSLILGYLTRSSTLLSNAFTVYEASIERKKKDIDRLSSYMDRNFERTKLYMNLGLRTFYEPTDRILFKDMLMKIAALPAEQRIAGFEDIVKDEASIDAFMDMAYAKSKMADGAYIPGLFDKSEKALKRLDDPFIKLAVKLYPMYKKRREDSRRVDGAMNMLSAKLIDVKKDFLAKDFIPDANGTLRLTYGRIRGYNPVDAVNYFPLTTADGVLEKTTGEKPFDTPAKLQELIKSRDFGRFAHPDLGSVPVAMLYNMDTTGGNSGSPVLNARGELVGVNFDRAFEATVNDYAWSEAYSRSIAVDIRYVLWIVKSFGGADYILDELDVE